MKNEIGSKLNGVFALATCVANGIFIVWHERVPVSKRRIPYIDNLIFIDFLFLCCEKFRHSLNNRRFFSVHRRLWAPMTLHAW